MAMTKQEFKDACRRHNLTVSEFARMFGIAESTAYSWGGRFGVPRWATCILSLMDQHGPAALGCNVRPTVERAGDQREVDLFSENPQT